MNIFEQASRSKLRFDTNRGTLTVEQLWDMPLTSKNNSFDLDTLARGVSQGLKSLSEESFVEASSNPVKAEEELKLEILKHIIQVKLDARTNAVKALEKAAQKHTLQEILAQKKQQALYEMPVTELEKRLKELD